MNLFMNRFLVLIGGETCSEVTPVSSPKKPGPAEDLPPNGQLKSMADAFKAEGTT